MKYLLALSLVAFMVGCGSENKQHQETQTKGVAQEKTVLQQPVETAKKVQEVKEKVSEKTKKVEQKVAEVSPKELYKKCAGCHGPHGERSALGKSNILKGWKKAKIVEALNGYKKGTRNIHGMGGVMKGQVGSLSEKEIESLGEYISKF